MAASAPMTITLYNPESNEVVDTFSRAFIPTGIFSEIVRLRDTIDMDHPERLDQNAVDTIFALVVEIFGDRFSIDQVRKGTDLLEVLALLTNILARVGSVMPASETPNPTPPGPARRRHRSK